jgi:endo-alpha-1,4-polygalactosaminidase (GH114 family)
MAKHGSVRQRRNTTSTAREIVLRGHDEELLPVPALPDRVHKTKEGELVPVRWNDQVVLAWAEMWQYPLVYEAPAVDQHLMLVYVDLLQDFWERSEAGRPRHEIARDLRSYAELWGIGEKSRRHLQITIQQAEEAIERGVQRAAKRIESSAVDYAPNWTEDDEDDGSIVEADVVEDRP